MSEGAADRRPRTAALLLRPWCVVAGAVALLATLVPPLETLARRTEYAASLQFSMLAIAVPALMTLGGPWRRVGLAGGRTGGPHLLDTVADRHRRHRELSRSLGFIGADLALAVLWHTPVAVEALSRHWWLAIVEGATLLVAGVGLWLELVTSPPLEPRSGHLRRAVLAALSMWVFWILAYVTGLSTHGFYNNFHHVSGGLSATADEQIGAMVLWFVAASAFVPVIFWNALAWLQSEDDPDTELLRLARAEQRRGTAPVPPGSPGPAPGP
jgi:cytochrome c oxidase assembly factor CtaG